jgi:hypothetical protein
MLRHLFGETWQLGPPRIISADQYDVPFVFREFPRFSRKGTATCLGPFAVAKMVKSESEEKSITVQTSHNSPPLFKLYHILNKKSSNLKWCIRLVTMKVMRMFLFNPGAAYDIVQISDRMNLSSATARKEVQLLQRIGFLKRRIYTKEIARKRGKRITVSHKRTQGWTLNPKFPYLSLLQSFLVNTNIVRHKEILRRLNSCGKIKLVILAGVFIHDPESRVDILIVGDGLKKGQTDSVIRTLEADIGKELKYAAFETKDFHYRLSMCDKLIRDILDYSHETIIDRLGVITTPV